MKKKYIVPISTLVSLHSGYVCQGLVGSVQGNLGLQFLETGDADPI